MHMRYKRLISAVCAMSAALCMTAVTARAEVRDEGTRDGYSIKDESPAETADIVALAEDKGDEKKEETKPTFRERTYSSRQIYACIGGGTLAVLAIITLMAEERRR